ncbi:hypothetical protein [Salininema proteolyticum]|uniref:Uncharacterized protein n=1 Tax=Salininema proteolyticum TaxID=1607685 RepID=A0ABV8U1W7_9ACTN
MRPLHSSIRNVIAVALAAAAGLAAPLLPATAQAQEGSGETACTLNDIRLNNSVALAAADDGWWVVPAGDDQAHFGGTQFFRVGSDCNVHEQTSVQITHTPYVPTGLSTDSQGRVWLADTGFIPGEQRPGDQVAMTSMDPATGEFQIFRFAFPSDVEEFDAATVTPDGEAYFFVSEGETLDVYGTDDDYQEQQTPLDAVGSVTLPESAQINAAAFDPKGEKVVFRSASKAFEYKVDPSDWDAVGESEPGVTELDDGSGGSGITYQGEGEFATLTQGGQAASTVNAYEAAEIPAAEKEKEGDEKKDGAASESEEGGSMLDWILDNLGPSGIVKALVVIALVGAILMGVGIFYMRKYRRGEMTAKGGRRRKGKGGAGDDAGEEDPADADASTDGFFTDDDGDMVKIGVDSGAPDEDLGRVAKKAGAGNVYGSGPAGGAAGSAAAGAASAADDGDGGPSGKVYGADKGAGEAGSVYGAGKGAGPAGSGQVYGAGQPGGKTYGGGDGDSASGTTYGAGADKPGQGTTYGSGGDGAKGAVYGAGASGPAKGSTYGGKQDENQGRGAAAGAVYGSKQAPPSPQGAPASQPPSPQNPPRPQGSTYGSGGGNTGQGSGGSTYGAANNGQGAMSPGRSGPGEAGQGPGNRGGSTYGSPASSSPSGSVYGSGADNGGRPAGASPTGSVYGSGKGSGSIYGAGGSGPAEPRPESGSGAPGQGSVYGAPSGAEPDKGGSVYGGDRSDRLPDEDDYWS